MNITDIESYIRQRKVLEIFARSAFDYIRKYYPDMLEYKEESTYEDFSISENWFSIKYYNAKNVSKKSSVIEFSLKEILEGSWKDSLGN